LGGCVYDVIAPEHRDAFRTFNERVCRGRGGSIEFDIIGLKGTRRNMETTAVPLPDAAGGFNHLAVSRDVTARRREAEAERRLLAEVDAERGRLEEVFRLAPSFMAVLRGPDHVFERVNERFTQLVGGRELIGKSIRDAFPEVEGQGFFEVIDRVYETGEPFVGRDVRIMLRRGNGGLQERILEFVYQPMRDGDGAVSGILAHGIDLTERQRAEADLARVTAESERRRRLYETALSTTPDLVYVFDLDRRFTYANEALLATWGRTWDEAIGRTCLEVGYEPWHAAMHDREVDQVVATRGPIRGEVPFTGTNGRRIYDYIFVPVIGAGGEVEAVAGTARDVTERKAMEDALREADRRKDEFLALLAHELRNPLAPVRNGLQVLRLADTDADARASAREMMERQLGHMVRLIDDLLDISRISRNKLELRRSRMLLADAVSSAVETARPMIEAAGHRLTVSLPPEPVYLDADLTRLAQVFGNLLSNSAKYTHPGGHIRLAAELAGADVLVSVRDDGIGIPAGSLATIFDMFSQVDRSIERSTGGLGIGLALVKSLVEMHGGTVSAESGGDGKGSTFAVRLPKLEAPSKIPGGLPIAPDRPAAGAGRRILVVDDNGDSALSMARLLRFRGNEARTAHDGMEALEAAEEFRPEVILMDVGMPRLNGFEATRRIREQPWGRSMIIIALTGWGQVGDRERSREAGCDGHLVKPVDLAELESLLAQLSGDREHAG
ncbi:MAG TPA: PAS domain-containing protein, partial [Isosphaeraceae bacterium]